MRMRHILIPLWLLLALGCGGMMGIFIPELPVELPADARVFSGRTNDAGITRVSGSVEASTLDELERSFRAQLVRDGWGVTRTSEEPGAHAVLTGIRGDETVVITLRAGRQYRSFEVIWSP